jgi:hypothetical protein
VVSPGANSPPRRLSLSLSPVQKPEITESSK